MKFKAETDKEIRRLVKKVRSLRAKFDEADSNNSHLQLEAIGELDKTIVTLRRLLGFKNRYFRNTSKVSKTKTDK